ncbi:MarR family winged helix-turn-helix transcriptional regulator [Jatrophihabitans fulvus]
MTERADTSALALDDQLCFALYAASRAMTARYRPLLDALGLTYPQYLVMMLLWDEGPSTVSELGSRLRLDSGTLSPLLQRLDARGLITRTRSSEDERAVEVAVTAEGAALRDGAAAAQCSIEAALEGFDVAAIRDELTRIEARLRTS